MAVVARKFVLYILAMKISVIKPKNSPKPDLADNKEVSVRVAKKPIANALKGFLSPGKKYLSHVNTIPLWKNRYTMKNIM